MVVQFQLKPAPRQMRAVLLDFSAVAHTIMCSDVGVKPYLVSRF